MAKRYRWNKRTFVKNLLMLLTVLGYNALIVWMFYRWIILGGAA